MLVPSIGNSKNIPQPFATLSNGTQGTSGTSTNSSTSSTDANSIGGTFLTLLTQELQNQDPTAPMDSTEMVGQMISLNQLEQLTSINQTLTNQFPAAASDTSNVSGSNGAPSDPAAAVTQAALQTSALDAALAGNTSPATPSIY